MRTLAAVMALVLVVSACGGGSDSAELEALREEVATLKAQATTMAPTTIVPESWEDQADETGEGLVEREFTTACLAANNDLPTIRAKDFCGCVLDRVQAAVTFEEFKSLDDFIDKHRDDLTAAILREDFGWFVEATETCAA